MKALHKICFKIFKKFIIMYVINHALKDAQSCVIGLPTCLHIRRIYNA